MLMKTPKSLIYLSADELGITERERAGLIEVRDDLASGRVKHVQPGSLGHSGGDHNAFNMLQWDYYSDCGTCHCIGGFMQYAGYLESCLSSRYARDGYSEALHPVFYPKTGISGDETPAQAVLAIDHFLAGAARECWPLALADEPA